MKKCTKEEAKGYRANRIRVKKTKNSYYYFEKAMPRVIVRRGIEL